MLGSMGGVRGGAVVLLGCLALLGGAPRAQAQAGGDAIFSNGFEPAPLLPSSDGEAARFLTQATFGPRRTDITALRALSSGYSAWIDAQMALPTTSYLSLLDARIARDGLGNVNQVERQQEWFRMAMTAPDQLRQRVAFALSQIFVVSDQLEAVSYNPNALASYYDILSTQAFGNYRTLLEQVTLHPVMGHYLSMYRNRKSTQDGTIRPDENYAREIMQLFSVGLVMLNPDGTLQDGNAGLAGIQPIPTYGQATIQGMAAVMTGWNFNGGRYVNGTWTSGCGPSSSTLSSGGEYVNYWEWEECLSGPETVDVKQHAGWRTAMAPFDAYHQVGAKQLLVYPGVALAGGVLPSRPLPGDNSLARDDLRQALDNIFYHPNVGPFISKLLIQRLVTSNPSPAYVARVAAAFNDDNGAAAGGVRGNLGAVVRAILLDNEARNPTLTAACTSAQTGCVGKLREPLLRLTQLWRAMNAVPANVVPSGTNWYEFYTQDYSGQGPLTAPSVFNFFLPAYAVPGPDVANRGLVSPEFQITIDTLITRFSNALDEKILQSYVGSGGTGPERPIQIDLTADVAIAADGNALLDRYNTLFYGGRMSAATRAALLTHLNGITSVSDGADWLRLRVQEALWLIFMSPEFVVEK